MLNKCTKKCSPDLFVGVVRVVVVNGLSVVGGVTGRGSAPPDGCSVVVAANGGECSVVTVDG